MSVNAGTRFGPYEILSAIGAGGMGEVYKARDTRLDRIVAIKVLPTHLADRAELRERFEREAKTIASLNHPHICTLYDTGHQDEVDFLVMEYIEGETLAQRLQKGALPIQQVLQYAIEIADALDKAHRKGITHRDLKPGNIMLTKSGTKLLDFRIGETDAGSLSSHSGFAASDDEERHHGRRNDPRHVAIHGAGASRSAKKWTRARIFSRSAPWSTKWRRAREHFEGKSFRQRDGQDPGDWIRRPISSLQPMTPPQLDRVVKTCMAKDPDERWQTASDLCRELKWISEGGSQAGIPPSRPRRNQDGKNYFPG